MRKAKGDGRIIRTAWRRSYAGLSVILLFSVLTNLLKLATPLYVMQVLDRIPASRSIETLVMLTVITIAAVLTGVIIDIVRRRMFMHWGAWIEQQFGPKLVHDGLATNIATDVMAPSKALRDLSTVRQFISGSGLITWLDVVWAPFFVALVYLIDPMLALIVFIAALAVLALGLLQEISTRSSNDAARRAQSTGKKWVAAAERSSETIGPLSMADSLARRWSDSASESLDEGMRSKKRSTTIAAAIYFLGRSLRIALLCVGILLVINSGQTLGAIMAAGVLGRMAFKLVEKAMSKWRDLVSARAAYGRMCNALGAETAPYTSMIDHQLPAPLSIRDVGHRYSNQTASVVKRVSVTMRPGEVLCMIGPSASGKTTLSRLVSGLLRPKSGSIRLGDVDTARLPQNGHARYVGYLPQEVRLFSGTVRENIARMELGDFSLVVEAAQLTGMHDIILQLPQGYDTEIAENEPLLSTGQRKGIALARALYGWPQLIVLDEPEPHIDRTGRRALMQALKTCTAQGSIVVVTSQSRGMTKIADKVLLLGSSRVELLDSKTAIAALLGVRTKRRSEAATAVKQGNPSSNA